MKVQRQHARLFLRFLGNRASKGQASAIDQDVEASQLGDRSLDRSTRLVAVDDIGLDDDRPSTCGRESEAAMVSSRSRRAATRATLAPSAASRRAVASPIPLLAPVTSATTPSSFVAIGNDPMTCGGCSSTPRIHSEEPAGGVQPPGVCWRSLVPCSRPTKPMCSRSHVSIL